MNAVRLRCGKLMISLLALLIVAATSYYTGVAYSKEPAVSPHSEAIRLVFDSCKAEIRSIDPGDWWVDTREREWRAIRVASPGQLDTTHQFFVEYRIEDRLVAAWYVDTEKSLVEHQKNRP